MAGGWTDPFSSEMTGARFLIKTGKEIGKIEGVK